MSWPLCRGDGASPSTRLASRSKRLAAQVCEIAVRVRRRLAPGARLAVRRLASPGVNVLEVRGRVDRRLWPLDLAALLQQNRRLDADGEVLVDLTRARLGDPVVFSDLLVHAYNQLPRDHRQRLKIITGMDRLEQKLRSWFSIEGVDALFDCHPDVAQALAACRHPRSSFVR